MQLPGLVPVPPAIADQWVADGLWDGPGLRAGLEAWADRAPDRAAVIDDSGVWSYRRLADATGCAVGGLAARGIGEGRSVVVVAPLSAPAAATYAAVLRTGATAVMIDRRCGRADLLHACSLPGVALVVVEDELGAALDVRALGLPVCSFGDLLRAEPAGWSEPDPRAVAAVVFTSGTTSRPKGVAHSLNTVRSGARALAEVLELGPADGAFLSSPLASITGLVQLHMTLERGAALVLEDRFHPAESLGRLRAAGATVLGGAPIIVEELFRQAAAEDLQDLPLRRIVLGGAMVPREVLELATGRFGISPVRMYGASEVPCATGTLPSDEGEVRLSDDGAAARGTRLRTDGPVAGEVLVLGPMRCLGYLEPEENASAFTDDGWYRTGDLGAVQGDRLTVTGRLKEVVARKGMKISLPEVDEAARTLVGVQDAVAYGTPDPDTGERLVLAVHATRPDDIVFEDVVGQLMAAGLAKFKLPEQVVVWDSPFPRTESGKVQRRLLGEQESTRRVLLAPRLRQADGPR